MLVGHAHPRIVEAIAEAASRGTHFAVTTESAVAFAEEIARRFHLEMVRFANSGTEATMDAIRVARAATGRDVVCKIEGSYHGHHDAVMFSVIPNADVMGGRERPASAPVSKGMVKDAAKYIEVAPFNDAPYLEQLFTRRGSEIACLIMEPAMMNLGIVLPQPGYLQRARELCTKHGVVFIFDEIKTGFTIAAGGATERFGVQPDLVCLAKAISGGLPAAAFGGREDLMRLIERGVSQMGTYNGNPLVSHVGLVTLREILTPDAYRYLARLGTRLAEGLPGRHRPLRDSGPHDRPRRQGLRLLPPDADDQLPRLPGDPARALRGLVPLAAQPRDLHDPGRRGAVDPVGAAHRGGHRSLHRGVCGVLRGVGGVGGRKDGKTEGRKDGRTERGKEGKRERGNAGAQRVTLSEAKGP